MGRFVFAVLAALTFSAAPAAASTIVPAKCSSVSDPAGCLFSGNITTNANGNANSYLSAQNQYNALVPPAGQISLKPIASSDDADFGSFGSITGAGTSSGTWTLNGYLVDYLAVKAGNAFVLYQLDTPASTGSWDTLDLPFNRNPASLSHIVFFGDVVTAVPEPGTWGLMLLGFGVTGFAMRRKNAKTQRMQLA